MARFNARLFFNCLLDLALISQSLREFLMMQGKIPQHRSFFFSESSLEQLLVLEIRLGKHP